MNIIHYLDHDSSKYNPEDTDMSRISYDGLLLQAYLHNEQHISINDIALKVFSEPGTTELTRTAKLRARSAARNLVDMGQAKAEPNRELMTHITSKASGGTQLAALMNLSIRQAVVSRGEGRKPVEEAGEGKKYAIM